MQTRSMHTHRSTHTQTHTLSEPSLHWRLKQSVKNKPCVVLYTVHYFCAGRVKYILIGEYSPVLKNISLDFYSYSTHNDHRKTGMFPT